MPRSDQYKAFRRCYRYIWETLCPNSFAIAAFDAGLLSAAERNAATHNSYTDSVKNEEILRALERRIQADCRNFDQIVQLLREDVENKAIADRLEASLEEVRNPSKGHSSARTPPPPSRTSSSIAPPPPPSMTPPSYGGGATQEDPMSLDTSSSLHPPPPGLSDISPAVPGPTSRPQASAAPKTPSAGHTTSHMHPPPAALNTSPAVPGPTFCPQPGAAPSTPSAGHTTSTIHPPPAALNTASAVSAPAHAPEPAPPPTGFVNYPPYAMYGPSPAHIHHHPAVVANYAWYPQPAFYPPPAGAANFTGHAGYPYPAFQLPPGGAANYAPPAGYNQPAYHQPPPSGAAHYTPAGYNHPGFRPPPSSGAANYPQPAGHTQSAVPGHPSTAYPPSGAHHPASSAVTTVSAPTSSPTGAEVTAPTPSHVPPSSATVPNTSPLTTHQPSNAHHPPSSTATTIAAPTSPPTGAGVAAHTPSHIHPSTGVLTNTSASQPSNALHSSSSAAPTVPASTSPPTGAGVAAHTPSHAHPSAAESTPQPSTGPLSWEPSTGGVIAQATPSLQPAHAPLSNVQEGRQEEPFSAGVQESGESCEPPAPLQETESHASESHAGAEEPRPHVSEAQAPTGISEAQAGVQEAGGSEPRAGVEETVPRPPECQAGVQQAGGSEPQAGVQQAGGSEPQAGVQEADPDVTAQLVGGRQVQAGGSDPQEAIEETQQPGDANGLVVGMDRAWFRKDGVVGQLEFDGGRELEVIRFPAYKCSDSKNCKSIALKPDGVKVERGTKKKNLPYLMKCFPHGIAVIINNERFDGYLDDRTGTGVDEQNLVLTFRYLCYDVELYRNCTSAQILEVFQNMQQRDHSRYDSFICCILSHGKPGVVFGSDCVSIAINNLAAKLTVRSCPSLEGKPKLFFIQACRGSFKDPIASKTVTDSPSQPLEVDGSSKPNVSDFLFSYATTLGHVAIRHTEKGSWYVSKLCSALCRLSTHQHLDDMLKNVHLEIAECRYPYSRDNPIECGQAGELTSRLTNNVYFF